jgi:hypothetical protein
MTGVADGAALGFLKTGDLVLFAGRGLAHGLARWFGRSFWSHVALVLRTSDDPEPRLWEALSAGARRGTAVAPLAARIAAARGRVSVRCLNRALGGAQCERLEGLRRELDERAPSKRGLIDLMGAADDGWLGAGPDMLGDPMDGELVALAYQRLGLLDDVAHGGLPAGRYRPGQFAEACRLELKSGYALGPELVLRDAVAASAWGGATRRAAEIPG